jgi:hypothetical protein
LGFILSMIRERRREIREKERGRDEERYERKRERERRSEIREKERGRDIERYERKTNRVREA